MSVAGAGVPGGAAGAAIGAALLSTLERVEEDLDEKLAALDAPPEEDEVERLRAARLARLRRVAAEKAAWAAAGHGELRDVPDQKQFFEELKRVARAVVHFHRGANRRCDIVDAHLRALAAKHVETKFLRVDAERSPFVAEKLKVWALPTIVLVKDGRTDHSIIGERARARCRATAYGGALPARVAAVSPSPLPLLPPARAGFDELGGSDNFSTAQLEQLLLAHGVLLESFC
jgi:hypothetical protein